MFLSDGRVVRTVEVGYRPRRLCDPDRAYKPAALEILPVRVQRLVLICPAEELPGELRRRYLAPSAGTPASAGTLARLRRDILPRPAVPRLWRLPRLLEEFLPRLRRLPRLLEEILPRLWRRFLPRFLPRLRRLLVR